MKINRREFLSGAVAAAVLPRVAGGEHQWWKNACREIAEGRVPAMDIVVSDRYRILGGLDEREEHPITHMQLKQLIRLWVNAQG